MKIDRLIERTLFASRWLLAPIYLGLSGLLLIFTIRFLRELVHLAQRLGRAAAQPLRAEARRPSLLHKSGPGASADVQRGRGRDPEENDRADVQPLRPPDEDPGVSVG